MSPCRTTYLSAWCVVTYALVTVQAAFLSSCLSNSARPLKLISFTSVVFNENIQHHSSTKRKKGHDSYRERTSTTKLPALLDTSLLLQATDASSSAAVDTVQAAFNVATFLPQPFWLFLILLPNADVTKKLMGGMEVVTMFALVHFTIVVASIVQPDASAPLLEFNDVFDPSGNPQQAMIHMMTYPNFVSEEWSHVLTWDLFVGRWVWLDGLRRGVFTPHSVLFCNLIGPPGYLLHAATCLLSGKGFFPNEAGDEAGNVP